jgi:hypothetical protein
MQPHPTKDRVGFIISGCVFYGVVDAVFSIKL